MEVQELLFQKIREILQHTLPVDEVSDILNISTDGVYRRMRCETPLRLDEAAQLCRHFHISMDEIMQETHNQAVIFHTTGLGEKKLDFEEYLESLLGLFTQIQQKGVDKSLYAAKDIPVFHLFQFPELALFKMFFWQKTIYGAPELASRHFEPTVQNESQEKCISLCRQIADKYALIPSIEIWNEETSYSFIKQIAYYYDSGLFKDKKDALMLVEQVERLFRHIKSEAELGYKYLVGNQPQNRIENFWLYYNDLIMIDNAISVNFANSSQTFLIYNSIDYISTSDELFSKKVKSWLQTLTQKSDLISKVSERQRNKFFLKVQDKIDVLKAELS